MSSIACGLSSLLESSSRVTSQSSIGFTGRGRLGMNAFGGVSRRRRNPQGPHASHPRGRRRGGSWSPARRVNPMRGHLASILGASGLWSAPNPLGGRLVVPAQLGQAPSSTKTLPGRVRNPGSLQAAHPGANIELRGSYRRIDLGFRKRCACRTDRIVPCLVLDPFAGQRNGLGSGSTARTEVDRDRPESCSTLSSLAIGAPTSPLPLPALRRRHRRDPG